LYHHQGNKAVGCCCKQHINVFWEFPFSSFGIITAVVSTHTGHPDPNLHAPELSSAGLSAAQRETIISRFADSPNNPARSAAYGIARKIAGHDLKNKQVDYMLLQADKRRTQVTQERRLKALSDSAHVCMEPHELTVNGQMSETSKLYNMLKATLVDIPGFKFIVDVGIRQRCCRQGATVPRPQDTSTGDVRPGGRSLPIC
jgi:hypothetical protein